MRRFRTRFGRRWVLVLAIVVSACAEGEADDGPGTGGGVGGGAGGGGGGFGGDAGVPPMGCGDGVVDPGEPCDDADLDETDACRSDCTLTNPPDGEPIDAEEHAWTYVPIEGSVCRDGSPTGIVVNPSSASDRVVIYLEGGGACFDVLTCANNPARFDPTGFSRASGIFDRDDPTNPVRDASFVYVPYCTGDVHLGDDAGEVAGVAGVQEFRGYRNVSRALERIVPTFPEATQVLLTGVSAGGFGSAGNFEQVQRAFQDVEVVLLDDSGPPMSSAQITPCLQERWRETWGFDATVLEECGDDCPDRDDYVLDLVDHLYRRHPGSVGALYSSTADAIIRLFFGFGNDDCTVAIDDVPAERFRDGLEGFRDFVEDRMFPFGTYYVAGEGHGCISSECFYDTVVEGVPLTEFVAELLEGSTSHVGP